MNSETNPHEEKPARDFDAIVEAPETMRAVGDQIVQQLKTVFDPEIPVDIYELGLIYKVKLDEEGAVAIRMTLTSPMCPAAEELPPEVIQSATALAKAEYEGKAFPIIAEAYQRGMKPRLPIWQRIIILGSFRSPYKHISSQVRRHATL